MYIVRQPETIACNPSPTCSVYEYSMDDKDMNGALVHISGRYPVDGWSVNLLSKEMAYIIQGEGRIVVNDQATPLSKGDTLLILPGEKFFWEGEMEIFMPCSPAWTKDQYQLLSSLDEHT